MKHSEVIVMMHMAVDAAIGIEVAVNDVEIFKRDFYAARREARSKGLNLFDQLSLKTCPTDQKGKIWIVKNASKEGSGPGEGDT